MSTQYDIIFTKKITIFFSFLLLSQIFLTVADVINIDFKD